ncbi:hypothetical protein NBH20_03190 [Rhizobium sp. S153]|uniref:Uncharacterized protein n=1 Tax=Ciceribacter sichuanensis TaxID=2949647 RepID=A0ABT0V2X2_9HYPH|nr:hypothetical protein [Ciceribacter sp. S153]MCM2400143.1 hypothetical protein [Ciceribacter sp. S153]
MLALESGERFCRADTLVAGVYLMQMIGDMDVATKVAIAQCAAYDEVKLQSAKGLGENDMTLVQSDEHAFCEF